MRSHTVARVDRVRSEAASRLSGCISAFALCALPSPQVPGDLAPATRPATPAYWVDKQIGNDANDGRTEAAPFATIQRAASVAVAGDVVAIKRGVYRETVTVPHSGTADSPIVFSSYGRGQVVISGGDLVNNWSHTGDDVWSASVDWDANDSRANNTLFVGGELSYEARQFAEQDPLHMDGWGQLPSSGVSTGSLRAPNLTGFGDDHWNGAKITFHVNDWTLATRTVVDYVSSTGAVTFDTPVGGVLLKQTCGFYLHDSILALDKPGEWFKDPSADLLFYKAAPGEDPNDLRIEFKRRGYGFDLRARQHVHVKGITFRGTSLRLDAANAGNVYEGNVFFGYGKGNGSGFDRMSISGTGNAFRDNEIYQTFHTALDVYGTHNSVVNNYFHDIAIQTGRMAINSAGSSETLISHNTFRKIGRSVLDGYPVRSEFSHNLVEDIGRISWDTGACDSDGLNGNSSFSIFHHNVFRNTDARGIMEGFYGRNDNAVIHHNLFHDWTSGYGRPTLRALGLDFRQAYHNTLIGSLGPQGGTNARNAVQTRYNNNVQIDTTLMAAIGVDMRGNHNYTPSDFQDFGARDFRLAAGSPAIDSGVVIRGVNGVVHGDAPDAGALEYGEPMWAVGHDFAAPHRPVYSWTALPGTNLFTNAYFSGGIGDWTVVSGSPVSQDFNSWNMGPNSLTGTFRTESVELLPGAEITQRFEGLTPNSTYTLGCAARLITEVTKGDLYDSASSPVLTGNVRGMDYVTGIPDGGWVSYDGVEFGDPGQYDTLELLPNTGADGLTVNDVRLQVYLDSPTGQLLLDSDDLEPVVDTVARTWKRHVRSTFAPVTGTHSLYVVVTGTNATDLAIGSMRLLSSTLEPADKLTVASTVGAQLESKAIGAADWQETYETLLLTTGPSDTSVDVSFANSGRIDGYLDRMFLTEGIVEFDNPNIAETDGDASQSSTSGSQGAGLAMDGDTETISGTEDLPNSWWQVSFYQPINPGRIELLNPADAAVGELGNFTVSIWSGDPDSGGTLVWDKAFLPRSGVTPGDTFRIEGNELGTDGETRLASTLGTVVRVRLNGLNHAGTGRLRLAEVRVLVGEDVPMPANAARTGITEQSSDNSSQSSRGPHRAIDGYINPFDGFTSTLADGQDWWQVDLGGTPVIDQIRLFNRGGEVGDRLRNFRVTVWDGRPGDGATVLWHTRYAGTAPRGGSVVFNGDAVGTAGNRLDSVANGRVVRVRLIDQNFLSLTEVQVWTR